MNDNEFKEVKAHLGLDSSDNERTILTAIKATDLKLSESETKVTAQNEEIEGLKGEIASMNDAKSAELVNEAEKTGKINKESKESFLKFAKSDYEGAKAMIEGMEAKAPAIKTITAVIDENAAATITAGSDEESLKIGYTELAQYHPERLKAIADSNPDLLDKLIDEANKIKLK